MTWKHFYDDCYILCELFLFLICNMLCTVTHQKLNYGYEFIIHNIYKKNKSLMLTKAACIY